MLAVRGDESNRLAAIWDESAMKNLSGFPSACWPAEVPLTGLYLYFFLFMLTVVALAPYGAAQAGIIADVGGDWVDANTLPAGWSYLEADAANGGTETALTPGGAIGNGGNTGFGGGHNNYNLAAVLGEVNGGAEFEIFGDGQLNGGVVGTDLLVHPGDSTNLGGGGVDYVILRYTVSAADILGGTAATIAGSFRNLVGGSHDSITGYVYHNTSELFSASGAGGILTEVDGTFNLSTTVAQGDTIDFVVFKNGTLFADESAVRGTIVVVPEPATALMALVGLLALPLFVRRR